MATTIEIVTTQNVTIEYPLATLRDRIVAFILDFIIMGVAVLLLLFIGMLFFNNGSMDYYAYLVMIPVALFFNLIIEIFNNGKSLGKAAMNIKIVKVNGREPVLNDFLTRWAFRVIDIFFSFGSVAAILISSSQRKQRLGDIVANTTVIRYKPDYNLSLNELLQRATLQNYEPKYPEVRKLKEEDMILVKTVIERCRQYPNEAHGEALDLIVEKIKQQLNIREVPKSKIDFLKVLLKDYVVLTR